MAPYPSLRINKYLTFSNVIFFRIFGNFAMFNIVTILL